MSNQVSQYVPEELKKSQIQLNNVIHQRNTTRFIPINGQSGYSGSAKNHLEFVLSSKDLFDFSTMCLSFSYTKPSSGLPDDHMSSLIRSIDIYFGDRLIERIEHYGLMHNMLMYCSANDSFYQNEENAMAGTYKYIPNGVAKGTGDYIIGLDLLGITKIMQYIPIYSNNLRIVINLATVAQSHVQEGSDALAGDYSLNNVTLLCDTVEVNEAYKKRLDNLISSDEGLTVPFQTLEVQQRTFDNLNYNFNLNYAEIDSLFMLKHSATEAPTSESGFYKADGSALINKLTVDISGRYLTPSTGLQSMSEIFMAMRKSFASLRDANGSTILNADHYKKFTAIGIDCEKLPALHSVIANGLNSRENGYQVNVNFELSDTSVLNPSSGVKDTLYFGVLHRKMLKMSNNSVLVVE